MKEIKFKFVVKCGNKTEVTEPYYLGDLMDYVNVLSEYSADEILHELQYTGLKDKNNVEIYEGDVISVCFNKEEYPSENVCIKWDKDSYVIEHKKNTRSVMYSLSTVVHESGVIGNMYENLGLIS